MAKSSSSGSWSIGLRPLSSDTPYPPIQSLYSPVLEETQGYNNSPLLNNTAESLPGNSKPGFLEHEAPVDHNDISIGTEPPTTGIKIKHLCFLLVSILAMTGAIVVVFRPEVAWRLSFDNAKYQIVIVGLCLSVMNLCLTPIATTACLRGERRFGHSRLQNYEAIIKKSALESNASWYLKVFIGASTSFPICLSILYKLFIGGQNFIPISKGNIMYNDAWGLYSPPGLTTLGTAGGLFPLFNATVPFFDATTNGSIHIDLGSDVPAPGTAIDPPFPDDFPQVYGFNIVMLQADQVAYLDAPTPDWVLRVQQELGPNDRWTVSANILGTVTQVNSSVEEHRGVNLNDEDSFWNYFTNTDFNDNYISPFSGSTAVSPVHCVNLYSDGNSIVFLTNDKSPPGHHDQTWFFMGIGNCNDINATFADDATMFTTSRKNCVGEWTITRSNIQLQSGSCTDDPVTVAHNAQSIYTVNLLALSNGFQPVLSEFIGPFYLWRPQSLWRIPTFTTVIAGLYWARTAATFGPGSPHWLGNDSYTYPSAGGEIQYEAGLHYVVDSDIKSYRPGLQRSYWILPVLCIQPFLLIMCLILNFCSRKAPISSDFGIIALLAGVKRNSLDILKGASYSGELKGPVLLDIAFKSKIKRREVDYGLRKET